MGSDAPMQYKILIGEDDHASFRFLQWVIQKGFPDYTFEIRRAQDGSELYYLLSTFQPHIILTDIYMPQKNALEVLHQWIRDNEGEQFPILFLTSAINIPPEQLEPFQQLPMVHFLPKPFELSMIQSLLKTALQILNRNTP